MSEFENENYDYGAGYDDPGQIDVGELDPAQLGALLQQSSELGAQRAMQGVLQQQQQNQQFEALQRISQVAAEAERGLSDWDKNWESRRETAARVIEEHPSFINADALSDPEKMAEGLWKAAAWGEAEQENKQQRLKAAEDNAFGDRIVAAHQKSYSAYRQATDAGQSIHDVLDS